MISHISIRDFAIIKELNLDLHPGLNIITGETGAGKSIIIEAISMALGSRADKEYVRTGADKAFITITVESDDPLVYSMLSELGLPQDEILILNREISSSGKSLCRINGNIVPLSSLGKLCRRIADIHGQYDHQSLLDKENHVDILDRYGGDELHSVGLMCEDLYKNLSRAQAALGALQKRMVDKERQRDLSAYELEEIEKAALVPGEDEKLEAEIQLMENSESIYAALNRIYEGVYQGEGAAMDILSSAKGELESIAPYSAEMEEISGAFSDAYYALEDMNRGIRRLMEGISFSPEDLEEKQSRMELINRLKRKYGGSLESVLAHGQKAAEALKTIENADEEQQRLESEIKLYSEQYQAAAARLTVLRKRCAEVLEREIGKEFSQLNLSGADLIAAVDPAPGNEKGCDSVEFLIRTNKGEAEKPLAKIASGGELSRIMLAMKRIIGDMDGIPTMIFDEIDAGISGATAGVVGQKLKSIAKGHQIVCITHLPQIAACGDHHYRIEKSSDEISTHTTVVPLGEDDRLEELARLLSGTHITDSARRQAKELLLQL